MDLLPSVFYGRTGQALKRESRVQLARTAAARVVRRGRIVTRCGAKLRDPGLGARSAEKQASDASPGVFGEPRDAPGSGLQHLTVSLLPKATYRARVKQADTVVGYRWCFRVIAGKALYRHRTIRKLELTLSSRVSQLLSKLL